jgi:hypothetical protein
VNADWLHVFDVTPQDEANDSPVVLEALRRQWALRTYYALFITAAFLVIASVHRLHLCGLIGAFGAFAVATWAITMTTIYRLKYKRARGLVRPVRHS